MNKFTLGLIMTLFVAVSCKGSGGSSSNVSLKSDEDKSFYAIGAMFGTRLKTLDLSEGELNLLVAGLTDSAKGSDLKVEPTKFQKNIQELFKARMSKASEKVKVKGNQYFSDFLKEDGVKKTESGLAYKILKDGAGKKPNAKDTVEVHYHGTLVDGTVFDSSVDRGKTVSFPLNRVIKGWTEGLQLIGEGGKIKLVIPSELGYGDNGAPPKIPGGATLVFEVELFKIKDAKAPKADMKKIKKDKK